MTEPMKQALEDAVKICTSIEQSKKLIELGVDVNTADMWYQHIGYSIIDGKEKPTYFPMVIRDNISDDDIPAWSFSALLELIFKANEKKTFYSDENPLDDAFETVCWLKENNKL